VRVVWRGWVGSWFFCIWRGAVASVDKPSCISITLLCRSGRRESAWRWAQSDIRYDTTPSLCSVRVCCHFEIVRVLCLFFAVPNNPLPPTRYPVRSEGRVCEWGVDLGNQLWALSCYPGVRCPVHGGACPMLRLLESNRLEIFLNENYGAHVLPAHRITCEMIVSTHITICIHLYT
jgi:hypothetical protein